MTIVTIQTEQNPSSLEVEKFRRVVDYMEKTKYDKEKLQKGRKIFTISLIPI